MSQSGTLSASGGGGGGFSWSVVTSAANPVTLLAGHGFISKGAGVVHFILPAAANVGHSSKILGYGNLYTIGQNAGQSITMGVSSTSVGVGGSLAASQVRDTLEITCVTANTEFLIENSIGNPIFI